MMSRNLKGGAGKNFNFAFSSDGDDDSPTSPQKMNVKNEGSGSEGSLGKPASKFGGKPINLLS